VVEPSAQEVKDEDELDCARISLGVNQRRHGRLRQLVDALNRF
jgi:hypothetical protein